MSEGRALSTVYQLLFDAAPEAQLLVAQNICVASNQAAKQLFGETAMERPFLEMAPTHQANGRSSIDLFQEKYRLALAGQSQQFPWQCQNAQQEVVNTFAYLNMIRFNDKAYLHIILHTLNAETSYPINAALEQQIQERVQAETALRHSESQYRHLVESIHDVVFITEYDSEVLYSNPSLKRQTGYSNTYFLGAPRKAWSYLHPEDQARVTEFVAQFVASPDKYSDDIETRLVDKQGNVHWYSAVITKIEYRGKPALQFVARDITERKSADELFKSYTAELERSNKELQNFAYIASHDLQEPLRTIRAFSHRVWSKYSDSLNHEGRDYLERINKAAGRMQRLIDDLLTFSRISTQRQAFVPVQLGKIAKDVVADLAMLIEQTGGEVVVEGDLPTVEADPLQIRRLIQNLIGNALKFRRPEQPSHVAIRGQINEDPQQHAWCILTVQDNGIGFESQYSDRIFNMFERLNRHDYDGAGLGLAICHKIVMQHNGRITATSQPGQGATFIIYLPITQPKE